MKEFAEKNLPKFEKFQDTKYPFLYWIKDEGVSAEVIKGLSDTEHGLETGFGGEPSRLWNVDSTIPWIITEQNEMSFNWAKRIISLNLPDVNEVKVGGNFNIFALNTHTNQQMVEKAKTLLFRNFDFRQNSFKCHIFPRFEELRVGQRLVLVVDGAHFGERQLYMDLLKGKGYPLGEFKVRGPSPYSMSWIWSQRHLALDLVKE